jgi:hypothetical protein
VGEYERYKRDAEVLVAIGYALRDQSPSRIVLPPELRRSALAAWRRDEMESAAVIETSVQRQMRIAAGTLALIGLAVERAGMADTFTLDAATFAEAIAARPTQG